MESADIFIGALSANKESVRDAILSIKDEKRIPQFLEYLDAPDSTALYEHIKMGLDDGHPEAHLITAVVLRSEALINLRNKKFSKALSALIGSANSIGKFIGRIEQKTAAATHSANKRHFETNNLRNEVIVFWRENVDMTLSADKAAGILAAQFSPLLSFRTLSQYVSAEKKLHPPSRA